MMENFNAIECGWVSPKTPPTNHNNVVVLVWSKTEELYQEEIAYFEEGSWNITMYKPDADDDDFEVHGWFPIPYSPHNH